MKIARHFWIAQETSQEHIGGAKLYWAVDRDPKDFDIHPEQFIHVREVVEGWKASKGDTMNRLQKYCENFDDDPDFEYKSDVEMLRQAITEIKTLASRTIRDLYSDFSDKKYHAGWMRLEPYMVQEFKTWLLEEEA